MTMENIPNLMTAVMHSKSLAIQPGPGALKDISDTAKICWLQAYSRTFSPVSTGIQKALVKKKKKKNTCTIQTLQKQTCQEPCATSNNLGYTDTQIHSPGDQCSKNPEP